MRRTLPTLYVQLGDVSGLPMPTVEPAGVPPEKSERTEGTLNAAPRRTSAARTTKRSCHRAPPHSRARPLPAATAPDRAVTGSWPRRARSVGTTGSIGRGGGATTAAARGGGDGATGRGISGSARGGGAAGRTVGVAGRTGTAAAGAATGT